MTIAACYLSPEGVILGADSTTTYLQPDGTQHHLDYAQKLFEVGENGTMGIVCWGVGLPIYRQMVAELDDEIRARPPGSIEEIVGRWSDRFWSEYERVFAADIPAARALAAIPNRTPAQDLDLIQLANGKAGGFCLAGRFSPQRSVRAFQIVYSPEMDRASSISEITTPWMFWGCPNIVQRLAFGIDGSLMMSIIASGKWSGTLDELVALRGPHHLEPMNYLPLREAVDWVHSMLYSTIKMFKFSALRPVCGGPIEIAAITTDRPFRWIKHKSLAEAIGRINP